MATRSRGTLGRTTKPTAPPPFAGSVLGDDERTRSRGSESKRQPADRELSGEQSSSKADVKNTTLERREIPSFSDSREARIAEAAYWRAERRGFVPGQELDDWLEAERQIDSDQNAGEEGRNG